ncbi:uncharacterized protein DNG_01988 [Cephalotrichum gorgonifer]|uniref:Uncharacterized protein n=1 Tax=Cephalotrichum gorgonifer TaxID=2041049 RepID=A0AAE8MUD8_9PEZI|nr:uncharacterized protein DNG_01988 [Cephalotrichum gorgonifer]
MGWRWRSPSVETLSLRYLIIVPVLLAIATAALLFVHSDYNLVALYSQCHAHARIPLISRLPVVGPPSCYVVSFFEEAVASSSSSRAVAVMASILSFVAGLLTVYVVEGARVCNLPNVLIAYPTGPLLVFNLVGGAFIWELLITPAFFHRARGILRARRASDAGSGAGADEAARVSPLDPNLGQDMRHLRSDAEAVAIPAGVLLGFILPSALMLALGTPLAVGIWLFSPVYVTLVRRAVRAALPRLRRTTRASAAGASDSRTLRSLHLESHQASLALVYAAPVLCSALSHWYLAWHVAAARDDRMIMTRATLGFIEVDIIFTALTVLYWIFVEVGWRVVVVMLGVSALLGPGAGVCAGWIYREGHWHDAFVKRSVSGGDEDGRGERSGVSTTAGPGGDERTPLLT